MTVQKTELIISFTEAEKTEIKDLETLIDEKLRSDYVNDEEIAFTIKECPRAKVWCEIKHRYQNAGWNISFNANINGYWIVLS